MSAATSTARKLALMRRPIPLSSISMARRTVFSSTKQYAAASLASRAPVIDVANTFNATWKLRKPKSGWKKSIVSSSFTSSPSAEVTTPSVDHLEIAKTEESEEWKIEVDMKELQKLASQRCTPLSLKDMYKYAVDFSDEEQRLRNAQFLHRELPIRIAQRAVDLLTLPHGLSEALPIRQVATVYLRYLEKFQETPVPTTHQEEDQFTEMLQSLVLDRTSIPNAISRGVQAWRENDRREDMELERLQEMEHALYRFFTARVGLRFLTEHHILSSPHLAQRSSLREAASYFDKEDEAHLGCIQTNCSPVREVKKIVAEVSRQTEEYYGICPKIEVVDSTQTAQKSPFTYVPHHLHYMVGELLKNSCRASVRKYLENQLNGDTAEECPAIRIILVKGKEDVTIKIADRGGGIPRSKIGTIWKFAHSTAAPDESKSDFGNDHVTGTKIRGFGLPLARIYARYLGGELTLKSMEGYGLDAYLHLPRLGNSCENLPARVTSSPGELDSMPIFRRGDKKGMTAVRTFNTLIQRGTFSTLIQREPESQERDDSWDENTMRLLKTLQGRAL